MTAAANAGTVLIVDDQPDVLRAHAISLERAGYCVSFASNANDALDSITSLWPDAVLIDLRMPYINGMGLLYRIRALRPHTPIAIITGTVDVADETRLELESMGVELYFKPLTLGQLRTIVDGLTGKHHARSEAT